MTLMSRDEALEVLARGHAALAGLFARLSDEQAQQRGTIGGGEWSAKDLMGHIAFWEELAIDALESWPAGRKPRAEDIFGLDEVDAVNAENQKKTAEQSMLETRDRAARSHAALVALIHDTSDEDWESKAPYPTERRRRLGEMIGSVLGAPKQPFGHAFAHEPDLRAAVEAFGA